MSKTTKQTQTKKSKIAKSAISFGLASIDSLIDPYSLAYQVDDDSPLVGCIVGPDGVGKSILGLTAASLYAATNYESTDVRVIYASTDLNIVQADASWKHFGLDLPKERRNKILKTIEQLYFDEDDILELKARDTALADNCDLRWLSPFPSIPGNAAHQASGGLSKTPIPISFENIFQDRKPKGKKSIVDFLDLAEYSAGDDWGLLNRVIGLLECRFPKPHLPHLLVIDAVEGLETMAGNVDAFGLRRSRRSRLAQLVRIARKARCSILFVIEQKSPDIKLDEIFISDLVLRLNVMQKDGYLQKSIEIEKARSVPHVRGVHELQIRDGRGGYGDLYVPDDPRITLDRKGNHYFLGYMQVWPSLHQKAKLGLDALVPSEPSYDVQEIEPLSSDPMPQEQDHQIVGENHEQNPLIGSQGSRTDSPETSAPAATSQELTWFGIPELDELITQTRVTNLNSTKGRIVVSIGEAGTLKSRLAYSFLAEAFRRDDAKEKVVSGAILITSEGLNSKEMRGALKAWGANPIRPDEQVLVRPIQPRFLSSSGFLFRLKLCIRHMKLALKQLSGSEPSPSNIRIVIDNWNTILDSHPSLSQDPQILQRVFQLLREEMVLAHIVGTQPGSPSASSGLLRAHNIGQLEAIHLHTWPVDFFGDRKIAVTSSLPGSGDRRTSIYELARDTESNCDYRVKILKDFELYEDLESGKAKRVDLRVKLYSGFHAALDAAPASTATYSQEVSALFGDLFPNSKNGREVVSFENIERYDAFKEYIQNMEPSRLDETLVFQVDEFWNVQSGSEANLADLSGYLTTAQKQQSGIKRDWFEDGVPNGNTKVPLHKDFGLLLADQSAWFRAMNCEIEGYFWCKNESAIYPWFIASQTDYSSMPALKNGGVFGIGPGNAGYLSRPILVSDVWNALCLPESRLPDRDQNMSGKGVNLIFAPSWDLFLASCRAVANYCGKLPFDIDLRTSETLSSFILEVWISRIRDRIAKDPTQWEQAPMSNPGRVFTDLFASHETGDCGFTLPQFVSRWLVELDYSVRLVAGYLPSRFKKHDLPMSTADENSIAFRTWFAPAVLCQKQNQDLTPLRLPGKFSVRGDWHVGVANGSRSLQLAQNAIDKLVSDSMNRKRLRDGVGLPVRHSVSLGHIESPLEISMNAGPRKRLRYSDICELEPKISRAQGEFEPSLQRIFRSCFKRYDQHSSEFFLLLTELLRKVTPLTPEEIRHAATSDQKTLSLHEKDSVGDMYRQFISRT